MLAKDISKNKKDQIKQLEEEIKEITDTKVKIEKQNVLNALYSEEVIGAQIRSKSELIDDSEYNTKLFKSIEKSKQTKNNIDCLKDTNGVEIYSQTKIMSMLCNFYKNLYKTQNIEDKNIENLLNTVQLENILTNTQKLELEK